MAKTEILDKKIKLYKLFGMLWEIRTSGGRENAVARCINDNCELTYEPTSDPYVDYYAECPKCKNKTVLTKHLWKIAEDVKKVIEAMKLKNAEIINLEDEYFVLNSTKAKDNDYWVRVSINENKNGETQVMVLAGSLKEKNKTQLFLNVDNEKLGFDQNNTNPLEVFSKVEATFKKSKAKILSKKKD